MAPRDKKQKNAEAREAKDAETKDAKVAEPIEELETDAVPVKGSAKNTDTVAFLTADTTLNTLTSDSGILMSLHEGGMQHFLAGARANVGVSKGKYLFEAKIVELVSLPDAPGVKNKTTFRVGFSTAGSSLIVGASSESFCFDGDGATLHNNKRTSNGSKIDRNTAMVGVLLNLDKDSPNFNTVSLFKDGKRATKPVALPDELKGKTLFPHVCFKGVSVFANFGPSPAAPLPFKCNMIQDAAKAHCTVTQISPPEGGKYEVVYPVSLPDEGTFDWLDMYLEKNPHVTELSDRMIMEWAQKSGFWASNAKASRDKPDGMKELDDASIRRAVYTMAPLQARSYVVMEVKGNLLKDERKELLSKFDTPAFTKTAVVLVGEPSSEFKKKTLEMTLKKKQAASDAVFRSKLAEEKRKKAAAKRQKDQEKAKKKAQTGMAKKIAEAKKKAWTDKAAKALADDKPFEEKEPEDYKEVEEEPEEPEEVEEPEPDPPKVELTPDEKKSFFFAHDVQDLAASVLSANFAKFSLPTKAEGFDEVRYTWSKESKSEEHLKKWIAERKLTLRVEELVPGQWALKTYKDWSTTLMEWQKKLKAYKDKIDAKARAKAASEAKAKMTAALKAAKEKALAEGKTVPEDKKEEEDKMEVDEWEEIDPAEFAKLDVYGAEDILDVGCGAPLFKDFAAADWVLMTLRLELHLLAIAFAKDCNDPDRLGVHVDHIPFYYSKYFKKNLSPADYGVPGCNEIVKLVTDTVYLSSQSVLQSQLSDDMETFAVFAKLAEDARRNRLLRLDLGDEAAQLKLNGRILGSFQITQPRGQKREQPKEWGNQQQQGWGGPPSAEGAGAWGGAKWGASKWAKPQGQATIIKPGESALTAAAAVAPVAGKGAAPAPAAVADSSSGPKPIGIIRPGASAPAKAATPVFAPPAGQPFTPAGKGLVIPSAAAGKGAVAAPVLAGKGVMPPPAGLVMPSAPQWQSKGVTPPPAAPQQKGVTNPAAWAGKGAPAPAAVAPPAAQSYGKVQDKGKGAGPAKGASPYGKDSSKGGGKDWGKSAGYGGGKDSWGGGGGKDWGKGGGGMDWGKAYGKGGKW